MVRRVSAVCSLLALAACGGGGGGVTPVSTPVTTPTTPAPPTTVSPSTMPTGLNYDTAEYQRSNGAVQANALAAYNVGATGRGIIVGIVDSGIDRNSPEFAGRISAASTDLVANRGIQDEGGHGTAVAGVLGAAMNGSEIEGIAFDSTLLIARTDDVGSCTAADGCSHSDIAIARGIDLATENRARVINISLGGSPAGQQVVSAIGRATAQGIVIVIAGGNDGTATADSFAQVATAGEARGLVIVAGASDGIGDIASFSDRAGGVANQFLLALGTDVRSFDQTGQPFLFTGTSFSTPLVAGAVALLAQAFPTLTGAQIVKILFATARDGGAAGVDPIYGNGILDLTRAFQPVGPLSLAGTAVPITDANGTLSTAMGDAQGGSSYRRSSAGTGAVMRDGFGRAYTIDLARTLRRDAPALKLAPALQAGGRSLAFAAGGATVAVTVSGDGDAPLVERLTLSPGEATCARATAALVATRLGARTDLAFGFGQSGGAIAARLAGGQGDPFLVAPDTRAPGFERRPGMGFALRRAIGRFGLTLGAEEGRALTSGARPGEARAMIGRRYATLSLGLDRRFGPLTLAGGASRMVEAGTVLGARFGALTGGRGATTDFLDAGAVLEPGGGWRLAASARRGWTRMPAGGVAREGRLASGGFALDLAKERVLGGDRLSLRFAEPLRVLAGGYDLALPVAYDYATGVATMAVERLNLAPRGRERDAEAAWETRLGAGSLTANLYWRRDPGNIAALPDDKGGAIRYALRF